MYRQRNEIIRDKTIFLYLLEKPNNAVAFQVSAS